ncbi:MAG: periplasmic heavy metal sensor [Candidatus Margulisiibacteriota bacterium]
MNKKILVLACAMIIFSGMAANAFTFGPRIKSELKHETRIDRLAKELGLTEGQKENYLADAKKIEEETKAIRAKNKEIFVEIEKALLKDNPDTKLIRAKIQEISQNNAQTQFMRIEQLIQLRKELSPEQKIKLEEMIKKGKEKVKERVESRKKINDKK